jgi:hypothetical protein
MVVVDNARRMIGKNADISVTSVLQTTAGKMIFGRLWEESSENGMQEARIINGGNSRRPFQREQRHPAPARHVAAPEPSESAD